MLRALFCFASAFCLIVASALAGEDSGEDIYYEVRGKSVQNPNEDRAWSQQFDKKEAAEKELKSIERDHAKGGLLEYDPDKPLDLYVAKYRVRKDGSPIREREDSNAASSDIPVRKAGTVSPTRPKGIAPPQPSGELKSTNTASLAGTRWKGKENGADVEFAFAANGEAKAYDKYGEWRGTWRMLTGSSVYIELKSPSAVRYSGQIKDNRITGMARNPSNGKEWRWDVERKSERTADKSSSGSAARRPNTNGADSFVGKYLLPGGSAGSTFTLRPDGSGFYSDGGTFRWSVENGQLRTSDGELDGETLQSLRPNRL